MKRFAIEKPFLDNRIQQFTKCRLRKSKPISPGRVRKLHPMDCGSTQCKCHRKGFGRPPKRDIYNAYKVAEGLSEAGFLYSSNNIAHPKWKTTTRASRLA